MLECSDLSCHQAPKNTFPCTCQIYAQDSVMGNSIVKLLSWRVRSRSCSVTNQRDLLVDDLCAKIANEDTAAALEQIKLLPNVNKLSSCYGVSPLHLAVEMNNIECTEALLQHSADVNIKDCRLFSPLHTAAGARGVSASCIQMLLDAGSDVTARDVWNKTPLHRAIICANYEALYALLETGCDINVKDGQGRTCLMYIAHCPPVDSQVIEKMISHGADVNLKDQKDRSPLYFAVLSRRLELMELLIQLGSDLKDQQPMKLAVSRCYDDCVHLMLSKGAVVSLDMIELVLNKFKCGYNVDESLLNMLQNYIHLLKQLLCAYGQPLQIDFIRRTIVELFVFINTLKQHPLVPSSKLKLELSEVIPIVCLIISTNSVPLQILQPWLSMFDEYDLQEKVEDILGYSSVAPLTHHCRTLIRRELSKNETNLIYVVNKLAYVPSAIRQFILAKEFMK